jgi:uncharacterized protein (DUF488 family)
MKHESSAYTIGHSTKTSAELIKILLVYKIETLVDVRRFPKSHINPQFNSGNIEQELTKNGIRYAWLEKLGGRREGFGDKSMNKCWKSKSFRNYADYMETESFHHAAQKLVEMINTNTVVIMCAEALHWRCHRSMISDFLKSKSVRVTHILDAQHSTEHKFTECAKLVAGHLTYHETSNLDTLLSS